MKIVLTGGHLSPLLSLISELKKSKEETEITVIGRKYSFEGDEALSLEYRTISNMEVHFEQITSSRLQRKLTRYTLISLIKLPYSFFQAYSILKKEKPDIVVSFGGYVSLPVTIMSFLLGIPVVIHEQTFGAGFVNRISSIFAKKVCISWKSSEKFFPRKKTILVGNFLRPEIINNAKVRHPKLGKDGKKIPVISILGGSSGSHAINLLIEGCIERLLEKYIVFHQTGDAQEYKDYDRLKIIFNNLDKEKKERYHLLKFIDPGEIGEIINSSDLIVSRSGMNTVTELLFLGKPSILIPLPYSQGDEQRDNALFLEKTGLGIMLEQNKITSFILYEKIISMFENYYKYEESAKQARKMVKTDAILKMMEVVRSEVKSK